ncbi:MAG: HEAT repeat domain-containing protein [Acidobacteriota bacterium]
MLIAIGIFWCFHAPAVGIPHFTIDGIANSAEVIVVADVTKVRDVGPAPPVRFHNVSLAAEAYSAELSVLRTIKGTVSSNIFVAYAFPKTFVGYNGLRPGVRMVFLSRQVDHYTLANPYYSSFPAELAPPEVTGQRNEISDLVLSNMLAVVASSNASTSAKREILRVDYALPSTKETIEALRKGLNVSADRELSGRIQGDLIRFGDLSQLPEVVKLITEGTAGSSEQEWLLYVLANYVRDPRAVQMLVPLLTSSQAKLREVAASVLWHIADPAAVPALVRDLDDPDNMVRFYAVRGLSDIANEYGWGGPSEQEFREHEQKYLTHWKTWARRRGTGEPRSSIHPD